MKNENHDTKFKLSLDDKEYKRLVELAKINNKTVEEILLELEKQLTSKFDVKNNKSHKN